MGLETRLSLESITPADADFLGNWGNPFRPTSPCHFATHKHQELSDVDAAILGCGTTATTNERKLFLPIKTVANES